MWFHLFYFSKLWSQLRIVKYRNIIIYYLLYLFTYKPKLLSHFDFFLAYDLLKDRRTIDVIITKFFLLHFKMAESFEN